MDRTEKKGFWETVKAAFNAHPFCFLFVYGFLIMFFCTRSSPLYMFNGWVDANAYFTMGKGLVNGLVPYRDLFDHKGPLLFLIYAVGYLIDNDGFFGVYLIQSLFMFFILAFVYKTVLLFTPRRCPAFLLSLLFGTFFLQASCYVDGGGSPDEFTLVFESISLYFFCRYFLSGEKAHRPWVMFLHGAMAACVLLLKFNLVLFWVGFGGVVFLKLLIQKQWKNFFQNLLFLFFGVAVVCVPYVIYAAYTNSLDDFIDVFFRFNMIYSRADESLFFKLFETAKRMLKYNIINISACAMSLFGLLFLFLKKELRGHGWYLPFAALASYGLSLFSVYFSTNTPPYTFLPNTIFTVFGLCVVGWYFSQWSVRPVKGMNGVLQAFVSAVLIFAVTLSANGYIANSRLISEGRRQAPQRAFAEIINSYENPTLLMYQSLDDGFYTAANLLPSNRYFYKPSGTPYELYPYPMDEQNEILREKKVQFVVCRTDHWSITHVDNEDLNRNYDLIAVSDKDLQFELYYLLFQRKE